MTALPQSSRRLPSGRASRDPHLSALTESRAFCSSKVALEDTPIAAAVVTVE